MVSGFVVPDEFREQLDICRQHPGNNLSLYVLTQNQHNAEGGLRDGGEGQVLHYHFCLLPHVAKKTPHLISQDLPPYPLSPAYREGPCGCAGCGYRPVTSLYPCMFVGVTCTISTPAPLLILP